MSDIQIIGLGLAVVLLAVIRVSWLAGRKLTEPPGKRSDDD